MFLNDYDINSFFEGAIRHVGTILSIKDIELKSAVEIYSEIKIMNSELALTLKDFINAYREWYLFHKNNDDKTIKMYPVPRAELEKLIVKRDEKRELLKTKIKEIE